MTYQYKFVEFLNNELELRKSKNSRYSLRSFARFLEIEPSYLSKILRGKISFSIKVIKSIGQKLKITENEVLEFSNDLKANKRLFKSLENNHAPPIKLSSSQIEILKLWYLPIITEALNLNINFSDLLNHLSSELNISVLELKKSYSTLINIGVIQNHNGKLKVKNSFYLPKSNTLDLEELIEKHLIEIIIKSAENIKNTPNSLRRNVTMTFTMDQALLEQLDKEVDSFRRKIITKYEKLSKNKNSIYELSLSIFPWLILKE